MTTAPDLDDSAELLRVLGHAVRLRLLSAIVEDERSVGEIETMTGIAQPLLSQQLSVLRKSQLVETRREAKQIFYRINRERIRDISTLMDRFAGTGTSPAHPVPSEPLGHGDGAAMFARIG